MDSSSKKLKLPIESDLFMDQDVRNVMEFMERNIVCAKLVAVANSIKELATPFWGHYEAEKTVPISFQMPPLVLPE